MYKLVVFACLAGALLLANARSPIQDGLKVNVTAVPSRGFYYNYNVTIGNPTSRRIGGNYTVRDILPNSPRTADRYTVRDTYTGRYLGVFAKFNNISIVLMPRQANFLSFFA